MRLKALSSLVVGLAGFAATGAGLAAGAPAAPARTYAASAEAEGVRVTFDAPQFLVVSTLFDAANPISQATLESTGVSRSFASAPYPGDLVVTAPGTLAAFGGPSLPAGYPFYVAATYPDTPKAALDDPAGAYGLAATAAADRAAATGRLSLPKGPVTHTEAVTETLPDGTVRATAHSITEGLVAGDGTLTIGRVTSTLEVTSKPGAAQPEIARTFDVTGAKVGDTAVQITGDGVQAGPGAVPAGSAAAPVQAALAQAGLDVHVDAAQPLQGGGSAQTLVIRSHQQAPVPGAPNGVLTIRVGGASAAVLTGSSAAIDLPGSLGALPPGGPGGAGTGANDGTPGVPSGGLSGPGPGSPCDRGSPDSGPSGPGSSSPGSSARGSSGSGSSRSSSCGFGLSGSGGSGSGAFGSGGAGASDPSLTSDAGAAAGSEESAAPGSAVLQPGPVPIVSVPTAGPVRRAVRILFAVLAAAGALVLAGSAAFRRQGVQSTWTF